MTITELRNGEENGYKVEFVKSLPKDKIIIALDAKTAKAFLVTRANSYESSKGLDVYPIAQFEATNKQIYMTENSLLSDSKYKILALNTLADIGKISDAWAYK